MVSFLTPYWSGAGMMRLHLASIRRFHPDAPILVSARGVADEELDGYRREFGVTCWNEDCGYTAAYLRLLLRCPTRVACVVDHDTALLASIGPLVARVAEGAAGLVGVEERIRVPPGLSPAAWPGADGWLRFAPGMTATNFLIFDWWAFAARFGLRGVFGSPPAGARHFDFDYGVAQRLPRHHYLRPFHAPRYGLGNLLMDGDTPVAWHQWYGSYRTRLADPGLRAIAEAGEQAFLADFPNLDFAALTAAWGPQCAAAAAAPPEALAARVRRQTGATLRTLSARLAVALEPRRP